MTMQPTDKELAEITDQEAKDAWLVFQRSGGRRMGWEAMKEALLSVAALRTARQATPASASEASEPMTGDLLPCPFCGKSNQDRWPCEWLDGSGANVVRCAWCHGAAPMSVWNRRHPAPASGEGQQGDAENVCHQAYQAVSVMLSDLGLFESERGQKLLDNLSQAKVVHEDVLPWSATQQQAGQAVAWRIRIGDSDMWGYCDSEEDADFLGRQSGLPYVKEAVYTTPQTPDGYVLVPREPTEAQWGGLARDIVMWMQCYRSHSAKTLVNHLNSCGREVPDWLQAEIGDPRVPEHALEKGTIAAIIYKAMLAAAPASHGREG